MDTDTKPKYKITISIVTYNSSQQDVERAAKSILNCTFPYYLMIIDNKSVNGYVDKLKERFDAHFIQSGTNRGFGFGHNIGIKNSPQCDYYLILNPDITIPANTIEKLVDFMDNNSDIGLVSPKIINKNGILQHLNRRLPTVFDLFGRRLLPKYVKDIRFFKKRLDYHVMLDKDYNTIQDVPFVSGCFMLFRKTVLEKIGGFDENFFMYLEDADITRRLNAEARSVYYPDASVVHNWAGGSQQNFKLTWIHIKSAIYYFNKWGWIWI